MSPTYLRGQVIRAEVGLDEPKLFVVVSNNRRNVQLGSVLAARLTTSDKPAIPSIVKLNETEAMNGYVVCDDIENIYDDEVLSVVSSFSPQTMTLVNQGLLAALGML
jgi:mRNA interferase MazF